MVVIIFGVIKVNKENLTMKCDTNLRLYISRDGSQFKSFGECPQGLSSYQKKQLLEQLLTEVLAKNAN